MSSLSAAILPSWSLQTPTSLQIINISPIHCESNQNVVTHSSSPDDQIDSLQETTCFALRATPSVGQKKSTLSGVGPNPTEPLRHRNLSLFTAVQPLSLQPNSVCIITSDSKTAIALHSSGWRRKFDGDLVLAFFSVPASNHVSNSKTAIALHSFDSQHMSSGETVIAVFTVPASNRISNGKTAIALYHSG
jgi:hypothetical protein